MLLKGTIINKETAETLPGALVYESDSKGNSIGNGTVTNSNGDFELEIVPGRLLTARLLGFSSITFDPGINSKVTIQLKPKILPAVTVTAKRTYFIPILFTALAIYLLQSGKK